jgi:hypothetical protein
LLRTAIVSMAFRIGPGGRFLFRRVSFSFRRPGALASDR